MHISLFDDDDDDDDVQMANFKSPKMFALRGRHYLCHLDPPALSHLQMLSQASLLD
jgi:hypothetical protein